MPNDTSSRSPWPHAIGIPQRFGAKYERYQQFGGLVDITDDARAYAGKESIRDVERFMFLSLAFDQIHKEQLEGDFLELGVYQGSTAAVLARHARRLNRRIYLLDTYEGFDQQDFSGLDAGRRIAFSDTSLEAVRARVGEENTTYVKGYFPQTAQLLPRDTSYCLVHIDTDLYAPIMSGLVLYPRMVPGGFLIIHDYGSLTWEGAEKAVDTFFADKPESVIPIPDSSGSVAIRRMRPPASRSNWLALRQRLAEDIWHSAANGQLSNVLTDGWSVPEGWGTWGVGHSHTITLAMLPDAQCHIAIDIDLHAFAWEMDADRQVDVFVNGQWTLLLAVTKANNFASLTLEPVQAVADEVKIEFRPRKVVVAKEVVPTIDDSRTLGVALHRLRLRSIILS